MYGADLLGTAGDGQRAGDEAELAISHHSHSQGEPLGGQLPSLEHSTVGGGPCISPPEVSLSRGAMRRSEGVSGGMSHKAARSLYDAGPWHDEPCPMAEPDASRLCMALQARSPQPRLYAAQPGVAPSRKGPLCS